MNDWRHRTAGLRCEEVCTGLRHMGFEVRNGRRGGHKIVTHDRLKDFFGTDFNCGHGRNDVVKEAYIKKLLRVIGEWQDELEGQEQS